MDKTVLQIPVSKDLRLKAQQAAFDLGFSSLQESIRLFLKKLADETVTVSFHERGTIQLSPKAAVRYRKILQDIKENKHLYYAKNINDLFSQLDGDTLPRPVSKKISKENSS
ncbi:MAG TPA: hypothetical protein VMW41_02670 [Candidatus Bathyarchaeia archaeon]|nr:hypothetical protein [Candidatus Bathyarchaeia archaeon]